LHSTSVCSTLHFHLLYTCTRYAYCAPTNLPSKLVKI
jgi:hypothetical protein